MASTETGQGQGPADEISPANVSQSTNGPPSLSVNLPPTEPLSTPVNEPVKAPAAEPSRSSQGSGQAATRVTTNATCSEDGTTGTESKKEGKIPSIGTLLRLQALTIYDLPTPPSWSQGNIEGKRGPKPDGPNPESPYWDDSATDNRPDIVTFMEEVLLEGHRFLKREEAFKVIGQSASKPATAMVKKTHVGLRESQLQGLDWKSSICNSRKSYKPKRKEDWYGRRSVHTDTLKDGTATWAEFQKGLLHKHSEREAEYDPSVYDHRCILDWRDLIRLPETHFSERFSELSMSVWEMCHKVPVGNPRHFTTLVVSGKVHPSVFVTVQIPVDLSKEVPEAFYSSGRNIKEGTSPLQRKRTVEGQYVSIETCIHNVNDGNVKWEMTTCSDAGGGIPLWVQKLALPGAVAKDVGFFMGWARKKWPRPSSRNGSTSGSRTGNSPRRSSL